MNIISFYDDNHIALTPQNMKTCDDTTMKNGVCSNDLMLRAGKSIYNRVLFNFISKKSANYKYRKISISRKQKLKKKIRFCITIVAGSGNNGGDGLALAYLIKSRGINTILYSEDSKTDSHRYFFEKCKSVNIDILPFSKITKAKSRIVVDCLLGIGFKGIVKDKYHNIINFINSHKYIISADVASGLNALSGRCDAHHVEANETVVMQYLKTGHILNDGLDCSGDIYTQDLGIGLCTDYIKIVDDSIVKNAFLPLKRNIHKSSNGIVGIVANSDTCIGAGIFSYLSSQEVKNAIDYISNNAEASLISGAGLSKIFVNKDIIPQMLYKLDNAMVFSYEDFSNHKLSAIAYGMGVGKDNDMLDCILHSNLPTVLDADAINLLSINKDLLQLLNDKVILTPHPLEFSRLINVPIQQILNNPIAYAQDFAYKYNTTILLKGCTSIITNGLDTYINVSGSPCMAKGGSGDLLSGVIVALLARNISPVLAGSIASYICGKCGENLSKLYGDYSVLPLDYPSMIRKTILDILND